MKIVIDGKPMGKQRPRFNGKTSVHTPSKTVNYNCKTMDVKGKSLRGRECTIPKSTNRKEMIEGNKTNYKTRCTIRRLNG
ncbi:hypothetical protein [Clostridium sporogenes]|uniref:Uncharacterized protein n=1 Tax=Clostridium sporogenes TaxID=1509 RepID=A0ABX4KAG5_CLOSG|nr:hypothetical protein [Clostridium sporogenes]PHH02044.1 hypothetical protein CRX47_00335 [Clostridium sporogenes]